MPMSVGVSGAWKSTAGVSVGVSSAWKTVSKAWVGVGGAWKEFYNAVSLPSTITENKPTVSPTAATAGIIFNSNGTYAASDGAPSGNWFSPTTTGVGGSYEIRWTTTSGSLDSGTAGSWLALSSNRTFSITQSTPGNKTCVGTVEIRDTATSTVQTTCTVTLYAEVSL